MKSFRKGLELPGTDQNSTGLGTLPNLPFTDGTMRLREGKALPRHHTATG